MKYTQNVHALLLQNEGGMMLQIIPANTLAEAQQACLNNLKQSLGEQSASKFAICMSTTANINIEVPKEEAKEVKFTPTTVEETVKGILYEKVTDKVVAKDMLAYIADTFCNEVDKNTLLRVSKRLLDISESL